MSNSYYKTLYDNCRVQAPNGIEIFRCNQRKIDWYLKRSLAVVVSENPTTIRLNFEPNGYGWAGQDFFLQDRQSICSVCGCLENLTKHHVVPLLYRRHMAAAIKEANYYDVLPLCTDCHEKYEQKAYEKKLELAVRFNAPLEGINNRLRDRTQKLARSYLRYNSLMPNDRKEYILKTIGEAIGSEQVTLEQIKQHALPDHIRRESDIPDFRSHGELVVNSVTDFQSFVEEWRTHFVTTMNPQHLPEKWEIHKSIFGR